MEDKKYKLQLLRRYVDNKVNQDELYALKHLLESDELNDELSQVMDEAWMQSEEELEKADVKIKKFRRWTWAAAAAAAIITLGIFLTYNGILSKYQSVTDGVLVQTKPVLPGKNTAIITLANGKTIRLSSAKSGVVIGEDDISYNDGTDLLGNSGRVGRSEIATISTPRGGTYQVVLKDGSLVQLNAASSITFKGDFDQEPERLVKLSGEAYFEVAKMKGKPFVVKSNNQEVRVLGTHFNISAYADDAYGITTLLEGSVKINNTILRPNDQARQADGRISVTQVDPRVAVDWKNGEFIFQKESLDQIMKKVSRWYDVDVIFEKDTLREKTFSGSLSRYADVKDLLTAMEYAGIKTRIANRIIYIIN